MVGAVVLLFKTMENSYKGIIDALTVHNRSLAEQNKDQQAQIDKLRSTMIENEDRCAKKLVALQEQIDSLKGG
jgi:hypothetical protein